MRKVYLIYNPFSGNKKGKAILEKVQPIFEAGKLELNVIETSFAGHARELANTLPFDDYDGLCVIGGDGTMHEIVNGMLRRNDGMKLPIGLIAGGTGNSFMHDVDALDPEVAARRILTGRRRKVDIARADSNGEVIYGFNIVGWGLPTDITAMAARLKWLGSQCYNIASIIEVLRNKPRLARVKIGKQNIAGDYGFILGCNTIHTGTAMKMAPLAQFNDGLIDLIIVRKAGRLKMLYLFTKLFSGRHVGNPAVVYHQVKQFTIEPLEDHPLNIDGEVIGCTPVKVKVLKGEIEVLV
ncbi:diacylglycerol/lipid kinase family protein [Roseimarinus sediminis]|jgi:sphingosine kinase|uniref:diacylglycerol/lipid kinase family protein n=1 Tax=Roseimarinus sediminis TaxID=1610899 RepID=UPI003D1F4F23